MDIKNTKVLAAGLTLAIFVIWGLTIAMLNIYFHPLVSVMITFGVLLFASFVSVIFHIIDLALQIYKYDRDQL